MLRAHKWPMALALFGLFSGLAHAQSPDSTDESVAAAARKYRGNARVENPCPPSKPCDADGSFSALGVSEADYRPEVQALLDRSDFEGLDEEADRDRTSKARLKGGLWKLYVLYDVVSQPAAGDSARDSDWADRISLLKEWVSQRPQSVTARVALAECYYLYAWSARGEGRSDGVADGQWDLYDQRLALAQSVLEQSAGLARKSPHWYFVMLMLARSEGWPEAKARAIFDSAVAVEPDYYHSYREFALDLLPKWAGAPGDVEAFAEESRKRLGGNEGAFVYFEIATVIYCGCSDDPPRTLSWPIIQQGFSVMEQEYGATNLKLNRFAMLAYIYNDHPVMRRIFTRIGDNWDPSVWRDAEAYQFSKNLAFSSP